MQLPRFVLASASPRRAQLLRAAGLDFEVVPSAADEALHAGEPAEAYVKRVAEAKAALVRSRVTGLPVIAADTAVVVGGDVLGKPSSSAEATRMLERLSGRWHEVMTGVTLLDTAVRTEVATTAVEFASLSAEEIAWYVATGEGGDKAGGYAIQGLGSRFIRRIAGSYSNVVGLPVALVYEMLRALAAGGAAGSPSR